MKKHFLFGVGIYSARWALLAFCFGMVLSFSSMAPACLVEVKIEGTIGAGTLDLIQRASQQSATNDCTAVFLKINTPGGSLQSTRLIVEEILASRVPFLCLVTPEGGHAGSAGAIILLACHINGALPTTNIGAATPILGGGKEAGEDLRKKIINDTVSWLKGVSQRHGRNQEFAEKIITEAKSVTGAEAFDIKAVDILAKSEADFLENFDGKEISVNDTNKVKLQLTPRIQFEPDLRSAILQFVSDPEIAYLMFIGSLGLLYYEITHPGMILPGITGAIGLVLSLTAFHKLDVVWSGLLLILLGIGLMIAELFIASFGIVGIGGAVSFFIGSVLLFNTETHGFTLSYSVIFGCLVLIGVMILGLGYLALQVFKLKNKDNEAALEENIGEIISVRATDTRNKNGKLIFEGQVSVLGEIWIFESEEALQPGDRVKIFDRKGLKVKVSRVSGAGV